MKRGAAFPLSHTTYCNRRLFSSFQTKTFPFNPMLQIDTIIVQFLPFLEIANNLDLNRAVIIGECFLKGARNQFFCAKLGKECNCSWFFFMTTPLRKAICVDIYIYSFLVELLTKIKEQHHGIAILLLKCSSANNRRIATF